MDSEKLKTKPGDNSLSDLGPAKPRRPLIGEAVLATTREVMAGWYVKQIAREFHVAGVVDHEGRKEVEANSTRRDAFDAGIARIDFSNWEQVRNLLRFFERVLIELQLDGSGGTFKQLERQLLRDGFEFRGRRLLPIAPIQSILSFATAFADSHDELLAIIERMEEAVATDPALAVGSAKELLEAACKTILCERQVDHDSNEDLVKLTKMVAKELMLLPDQVPERAKGVEIVRRLLQQLGAVPAALGELRNLYGTGHGRGHTKSAITTRHARLAVGAATTLVHFIFETHAERLDRGASEPPEA